MNLYSSFSNGDCRNILDGAGILSSLRRVRSSRSSKMKKATLVSAFAVGAGLMLSALPVLAHHSFAAEYDNKQPVTLTGTVTKVEWMNPHARFYINAKDESGKAADWELELGSPNGLMRQGWTRNSLKEGDV